VRRWRGCGSTAAPPTALPGADNYLAESRLRTFRVLLCGSGREKCASLETAEAEKVTSRSHRSIHKPHLIISIPFYLIIARPSQRIPFELTAPAIAGIELDIRRAWRWPGVVWTSVSVAVFGGWVFALGAGCVCGGPSGGPTFAVVIEGAWSWSIASKEYPDGSVVATIVSSLLESGLSFGSRRQPATRAMDQHAAMLSRPEDVPQRRPALEHLCRGVVFGDLLEAPGLKPRDRGSSHGGGADPRAIRPPNVPAQISTLGAR